MTREPTLLAHLVPKLTSQVEDAATEVLAYVLNRSKVCRHALDSFLRADNSELGPITRVETQVNEEGSIPDMVGYGQRNCKRLVVESKFWAALQPDQAIRYLRLLDEPGVLLFIAPDSRIETLWWETPSLIEKMNSRSWPYAMPTYLRTGVEYDRVLDDVTRQVKEIADLVEKA